MGTERFTTVKIRNETGLTLGSVGVVHKYSDVYKHSKEWLNLASGAVTPDPLIVQYNTGFLTTGRDWWSIVAMTEDGRILRSDPSNMRGLWDTVEKGLNKFGWEIVKIAGTVTVSTGGTGGLVAAPVGAVTAILTIITNTESTKGFKQFFLEEKDAPHGIEIVLRPNEVEFIGIESTAVTPLTEVGRIAS
ncbi:hypothetical protein ACQZ44_20190 [Agrobacterium vitis]